jgi:RimJ/RimL family protein N-acetyltransferase
MELVTRRLVLRAYARSDFEAVYRFASDPAAVTHVTWGLNTEDETRSFLAGWLAEQAASPRTGYTLAITELGGPPFGSVGIYRVWNSAGSTRPVDPRTPPRRGFSRTSGCPGRAVCATTC